MSVKKSADERFGKLIEEQNGIDFPFYDGGPVTIPVWKWVVAWFGTFLGFLVLSFYPAGNNIESLVPRFLFMAIPLVIFAYLLKPHWRLIFKKPRPKDCGYMVLFAVLNMILTPILGILVMMLGFPTAGNVVGDSLAGADALELAAFYTGTKAILWAWFVSAIWFGAVHFPTYQWNIIQALIIIGGARIVLTLAFIRTKNVWVSTGAHIINDWVLFTGIMLLTLVK